MTARYTSTVALGNPSPPIPMQDNDYTLTSPLRHSLQASQPLLCASILWHPERSRIGAQALAGPDGLALARYQTLFFHPGQEGLPLGFAGISREALQLQLLADGSLQLQVPASRMALCLDGVPCAAGLHQLPPARLQRGVILNLGHAVLLCLHLMHSLPKHNPAPGVIGIGQAALRLRDALRQAAHLADSVLLLGETGCGKEVAARALHALGPRAHKPLVTANMAAMNEGLAAAELFGAVKGAYTGAQSNRLGLFQQAAGGTLFLDEIGDTPASVQPMLLRVLEGGDFRPLGSTRDEQNTARLIAATDRDLYNGQFNQALLRRLETLLIPLPPLRARREDIGVLIHHLLQSPSFSALQDVALPLPLLEQMACYDWPGNIRQLSHVLKRALLALQREEQPALHDLLDAREVAQAGAANALAASAAPGGMPATTMPATAPVSSAAHTPRVRPGELQPAQVLQALQAHGWEILAAAQALGISRPSMYKLIEQHPQIRRAETLDAATIRATLQQTGGDLLQAADLLCTPLEGLRRQARALGLD